ncbi:hypothetical protein Q3G72_001236 [Acer saccharum]|nr:hypothetical protein Q3G72_001236 [Acer saccharum]
MEEAVKVAKMVNGSHLGPGTPTPFGVDKQSHPDIRKDREIRSDYLERCSDQGKRAYVEVAKRNVPRNEVSKAVRNDQTHIMTWFGSKVEEEWLMRSTVGELKEFSNIELVNKKLETRGFIYSSVYLGGKSVMWTFESNCKREGFIRNGLFWRECFSSMTCWKFSPVGSSRLIWVDVYGVSIDCWSKEFFRRIGGQMGETVWVDEETSGRTRLDKGRILVLASRDVKINSEITVKGAQGTFTVRLEEDPMKVSIDWINKFLGLHPTMRKDALSVPEEAEGSEVREGKNRGVSEGSRSQTDNRTERVDNLVTSSEKETYKKFPNQNIPSRQRGERSLGDKGKGKKGNNLNLKSLWFPRCKGGIRIGGDRRRRKVLSLEEESSSSGSDLMRLKGPNYVEGETSKVQDKDPISPISNNLENGGPCQTTIRDSDPIFINKSNQLEGGLLKGSDMIHQHDQVQDQDSVEDYESFVAETPMAYQGRGEERGINLCIDLRSIDSEELGSTSGSEILTDLRINQKSTMGRNQMRLGKNKRVKRLDVSVRSHSMKTRFAKYPKSSAPRRKRKLRKVIWNLDEEIAKVIEKGADLGVNFKLRSTCSKNEDGVKKNREDKWNLEEEVTKVIETRVALGLDFYGREEEIAEYLSSRELKDEARFYE